MIFERQLVKVAHPVDAGESGGGHHVVQVDVVSEELLVIIALLTQLPRVSPADTGPPPSPAAAGPRQRPARPRSPESAPESLGLLKERFQIYRNSSAIKSAE